MLQVFCGFDDVRKKKNDFNLEWKKKNLNNLKSIHRINRICYWNVVDFFFVPSFTIYSMKGCMLRTENVCVREREKEKQRNQTMKSAVIIHGMNSDINKIQLLLSYSVFIDKTVWFFFCCLCSVNFLSPLRIIFRYGFIIFGNTNFLSAVLCDSVQVVLKIENT